jgi:polar amino acid transport system substrate-binding protein
MMYRQYCGLILLLMLGLVGHAQAEDKKLRVVVAGSPPFVIQKGTNYDGFSIKVWKEIARRSDLQYEFTPVAGVAVALEKLAKNEADVAVGPITITAERAETVSFSQPYFKSSLGLLSRANEHSVWKRLRPFFSRAFVVGSLFLTGLLMLVGGLVWIFERRANSEQFPKSVVGLGHGMWFAITTMTTVGYGDLAPKSTAGRLVTAVWMLVATLSFSTLTAGIATALALSSIEHATVNDPEVLYARRAAVVKGTTGATAARHFGAEVLINDDLPAAIQMLKLKQADVVVFDYPALQYYFLRTPDSDLSLAESNLAVQYYGFVVSHHSRLLAGIDHTLLKLREDGDLAEIQNLWQKEMRESSK